MNLSEIKIHKSYVISAIIISSILVLTPFAVAGRNSGFVHGIVIPVDGEDYYLAGAPDGPGGAYDVPGHYWVLAGQNQLVGKHYNTGPFGASQWWSTDAPDGELLFIVHAIIAPWSEDIAERMASRGYVHYHELIKVSDGALHPDKVVWLRHTARTSFDFNAGPNPSFAHYVTPGVDYEFMPNNMIPYNP
jgi:selenium-binding protein 1